MALLDQKGIGSSIGKRRQRKGWSAAQSRDFSEGLLMDGSVVSVKNPDVFDVVDEESKGTTLKSTSIEENKDIAYVKDTSSEEDEG